MSATSRMIRRAVPERLDEPCPKVTMATWEAGSNEAGSGAAAIAGGGAAAAKGAGAWRREALVFSTSFRSGLDPVQLQAVLPKDLIHEMVPGTKIFTFFERWKTALRDSRAWSDWGLRQWFGEAAKRLASHGYDIELRRRYLRRGYLIWRRPDVDRRSGVIRADKC